MVDIQEFPYYNELCLRAETYGSYDLSGTCAEFNNFIKSRQKLLKDKISGYYYILLAHHKMTVDDVVPKRAYNPKAIPSADDSELLTYTLSKLPKILQTVMVIFMHDCLGKSSSKV
jgi:hypothetical protein